MSDKASPCDTPSTKGTVLVVDDHPINRLLMNTMLTKEGWQVVEAESADDAMALLTNGLRPCLVFMDIRMPTGDGFSATRRIRQWEASLALAPMPVVALTADGLDETRRLATEAGMTGYVTKPVSLSQIQAVMSSVRPA